jgi:hypothetical protein
MKIYQLTVIANIYFEVEADSEEEATFIAKKEWDEHWGNAEIDDIIIDRVR